MTIEITEIARTETTAYGISFVVCTNKETNRDTLGLGIEAEDELLESEAIDAAEGAAIEAIQAAGCDCDTESFFAKWHGGPYSGLVHLNWHVADIIEPEEEGDDDRDEWEHAWLIGAGKTDVPAEIVAKAEAIQDAAINAAQSAADKITA